MKILIHSSFLLIILLFVSGLVVSAQTCTQNKCFPTYEAVLEEFFDNYSVPEFNSYEGLNFAKKKDGWHVYTYFLFADSVVKDELFWSFRNNRFLNISYPKSDVSTSEEYVIQYLQKKSDVYGYKVSPYFGYSGWNIDLIHDFSNYESPDDTLLEALARAYSSYASELIGDNTGYANRKIKMNPVTGQKALSLDQLNLYRKYEYKAQELYFTIYKRNPDYITLVGDIFNKYSSEIMSSYLALLMHHSYEEAKKELKEGLFDSFTLDMYRKHLACCDSNAILFAAGDLDTYTTLYLQEIENFRRDVLVINYGMLFIGKYVSCLLQSQSDRQPLETTLPASEYVNELRPVIYVNEIYPLTDLQSALQVIASDDIMDKIIVDKDTVDFIPSKIIELTTANEKIPSLYFNYKNQEISDPSRLTIELTADFLYQDDLLLLDILNTCHFDRPIYFTSYSYCSFFESLAEFMQMEGPNNKLMPFRPDSSNQSVLKFDPAIQYRKLIHDSPPYVHTSDQKYYSNQLAYLQFYSTLYYTCANELIREGKVDSARNLINHYIKNYLYDSTAYNPGLLGVVWVFYELKDIDSARYYAYLTLGYLQKEYSLFMKNPSLHTLDIALSKDFALYLSNLTHQFDPESDIDILLTTFYENVTKDD